MTRMRHKRNHHARRDVSRAARTRARKLDHDQIVTKIQSGVAERELTPDFDKPGMGQFYCLECDRYFPSLKDQEKHTSSKLHKRVVKKVRENEAYTQEEADRAAGLGVDRKQQRQVENQKEEDQVKAMTGLED